MMVNKTDFFGGVISILLATTPSYTDSTERHQGTGHMGYPSQSGMPTCINHYLEPIPGGENVLNKARNGVFIFDTGLKHAGTSDSVCSVVKKVCEGRLTDETLAIYQHLTGVWYFSSGEGNPVETLIASVPMRPVPEIEAMVGVEQAGAYSNADSVVVHSDGSLTFRIKGCKIPIS